MITLNEYAQFSSIVYAKTQPNKLPIPTGWVEERPWQADTLLGFSAGAYKRGSEIVISYTGTNGEFLGALDHLVANGPAGTGTFSPQVLAAINFYLQVRDANPGATISFTGHSLGGGLAALMAVYFGKESTTFAPAPFKASAGNVATMGLYLAAITLQGKSDPAFSDYIADPSALYTVREAKVEAHTIEGEVLMDTFFGHVGTIVNPAKDYFYAAGNSVSPTSLHSILLHAAVIRSEDYRQAVVALDSVLPAINDESLYASNAQFLNTPDFMHRLMQHEWSWAGPASTSPLNRFAADLLKLAPSTYGMASGTGMAEALVVTAMEYRYFKDAATATQLFTFDSYGLHFKYSDIGASSYKSLPKLAAAVNAFLTPEELALLNGRLVKQDAWHIQSGLGGMVVHAGADNDAMIGGANSDGLWAGAGNDIIIGGANNDVLAGEAGNDFLLGGIGNDTYIFTTGDGTDTLLDTDSLGVIKFGAVEAKGSAGLDPAKWLHTAGSDTWIDHQNGITYTKSVVSGETQLLIHQDDSNVLVKGWAEGELGIALGAGAPPAPNKAYTGSASADLMMNLDLAGWGWDGSRDFAIPGSLNRYDGLGGADLIQTDFVDDLVDAGDGNDYVLAQYGGVDIVNGGVGNDYLHIGDPDPANDDGASSLLRIPANNRAFVDGGDGNDTITVARQYSPMAIALDGVAAGFVYPLYQVAGSDFAAIWAADYAGWQRASSTFYTFPGTPTFTFEGWQRDGISLARGPDGQLNLYATFQFAVSEFSAYFEPTGPSSGALTRFQPVFIYTASSDNDDTSGHSLFGGVGNDMVEGGLGGDFIDGGADNDALDGERGVDIIFGGSGEDLILGGEGDDWLDGGQGNDEIYGEQGNDTYVFAKGAGMDRINDYDITAGNVDVVQFLDVTSGEVTALERNGNDLMIRYGTTDQLTVTSYFSAGYKIEQIQFSDGEIWNEAAVNARAVTTITGTAGSDTLSGGSGVDMLIGGGGERYANRRGRGGYAGGWCGARLALRQCWQRHFRRWHG